MTKNKSDGIYDGNVNLFYSIFDFKKFGYKSLGEVLSSESKFTRFIQTDGFGVCFGFARKSINVKAAVQLNLKDYSNDEVREHFQPCAVDPGRTHIFTATICHEGDKQERRCSAKERRCYTGAKRRAGQVKKLKLRTGVKKIETDFPSAKTVAIEKNECVCDIPSRSCTSLVPVR
jgi:hypothetical protein